MKCRSSWRSQTRKRKARYPETDRRAAQPHMADEYPQGYLGDVGEAGDVGDQGTNSPGYPAWDPDDPEQHRN